MVSPTSDSELVAQLQQLIGTDASSASTTETQNRSKACAIAMELYRSLEDPGLLIDRMVFLAQEIVPMRLALDLSLFELLENNDGPMHVSEIAKKTNVDLLLMSRIMRSMASLGQVGEAGPDTYVANKFTKAFTTPKGVAAARLAVDIVAPAQNEVPAYLRENKWRNPEDPLNGPLQKAFNMKKNFFDILGERDLLQTFHVFMSTYRDDRPDLLDVYPAEERVVHGFDSSSSDNVMWVDIGGGRGHEIQKFKERLPSVPGRFILQDLPEVVKENPPSDIMEIMAHNFFDPQPIKDARAYYFQIVLHDWPDADCIKILKNIAAAMKPGYSKLIINDIVIPATGATRFQTQSDMTMMAFLGAMERTEAQWRHIIDEAGLKVVSIWAGPAESVIEAELNVS